MDVAEVGRTYAVGWGTLALSAHHEHTLVITCGSPIVLTATAA